MIIVVGLGNPGEEYEGTRHNVGRLMVEAAAKTLEFSDWSADEKTHALLAKGKLGKKPALFVLSEHFMNNTGKSVGPLVKSKKVAEGLVVIQDDLDLPLGGMKVSFNRGSGGHRGIESIIKAIKTEGFVRIRVGVSPATPKGVVKKPSGEKKVIDFILDPFKPGEMVVLKKLSKKVTEALEVIVSEGRERAMNVFN